jgi:hypothetical protein
VNTSFDASAIVRVSLLLLGLLVALFLGVLVGESNWTVLSAIVALILIASVAQFTVRHLLAICLALVTLDFWMAPTGFRISPMEQTGIVAAFAWLLVSWRRHYNTGSPSAFLQLHSWRFFQNVVLVAAVYALAHFIYNLVDPYDDLAFGWKGASKAYSQTFGAFLMIVFLVRARLLFPIRASASVTLLWLLLATLIIGTVIGTARALLQGPEQEMGLSMEEKSELLRLFLIPGLNAHDNVYTLRQLGPAAVLIGSTFFFCRPRNLGPFLPIAITSIGFFACMVSAGRASLAFAFTFVAAAMFRAKRGDLAFAVVGVFVILVSVILILPVSTLRESPWHVQRSIGWFRPDLRTQATEGIEDSSDMRWRYFKFAWEHYSSGDTRMILFGRSVGQMDGVDVLSFVLYNELAQMEFAVRRLGTHNGLTDFLLGWGLLGYLFNICMAVSCIVLLFSYSKLFESNSHGGCWLFSAGVFMTFWVAYTHVGGAFVWPLAIVLVLISLAQTSGLKSSSLTQIAPNQEPAGSTDVAARPHWHEKGFI